MTTTAEVLALARGIVQDAAGKLAAEHAALPLSIFGTPVPRHYTIQSIREALVALDDQLAALGAPATAARALRRQAFTNVRRARCYRCGQPAGFEWSTCAIGERHLALCTRCDVGLNRVALAYVLGFDAAAAFVSRYEGKLLHGGASNPASERLCRGRGKGQTPIPTGRVRGAARARGRQKQA